MQPINPVLVQEKLNLLQDQPLYIHLEMTTGAYAAHYDSSKHPAATFITNAVIVYTNGSIAGSGPYRVGLKIEHGGWVYSEGLTHWNADDGEQAPLIMAGHDSQGKLVVALQLGLTPFGNGTEEETR